jgi:hypothetical protein
MRHDADVPDNPYRLTESQLQASTGHAPGQELIESEPEVDIPHDLPLRVTPMSPVSEIYAYGQLTQARPSRRGLARGAALFLLLPLLLLLGTQVFGTFTRHDVAELPVEPIAPVVAEPVAMDCAGGMAAARPPYLSLACGDGAITLSATWTSWTQAEARGIGSVSVDDCLPSCIGGKEHAYPVTVRLLDPTTQALPLTGDATYFRTLEVTFTRTSPVVGHLIRCALATNDQLGGCASQLTTG